MYCSECNNDSLEMVFDKKLKRGVKDLHGYIHYKPEIYKCTICGQYWAHCQGVRPAVSGDVWVAVEASNIIGKEEES